MTYTAGWNVAGYLPETDPETFETLADAVAYLRDTVAQWQDQDWEQADPDVLTADEIVTSDGQTASGWYRDIHLWAEPTAGSNR